MTQADQEMAAFVDRFRKDKRRFSGDMALAARNRVNLLKDARADLNQSQAPSPEAKALLEACQLHLDNQIKAWNDGGLRLSEALGDAAKAAEFEQFLSRLQAQEKADQAKVQEAQHAFLQAHNLPPRP